MRVFQFLSMLDPRLTARLARASASLDAVAVLDLEDSLWDVTDETRTASLKAAGRRNLCALAEQQPELFARQKMGVRLNRLAGPDAEMDLAALTKVSRYATLDSVVVTKIESESDLHAWASELRQRGVAYRHLVPIVETRAGMDRLDSIAAGAKRAAVDWIVYGHYDYALDSSWWPVPDHDQPGFWQHARPFIEQVERHGVGYVHPPFFQLTDLDRFGAILERLEGWCQRDYGVITLGRQQTAFAANGRTEPPTARPRAPAIDEDPARHAKRIIGAFLANKRPSVSFAIDPQRGEFISPHVYLAALDYQRRNGDD